MRDAKITTRSGQSRIRRNQIRFREQKKPAQPLPYQSPIRLWKMA
jgi:hypothetical protein